MTTDQSQSQFTTQVQPEVVYDPTSILSSTTSLSDRIHSYLSYFDSPSESDLFTIISKCQSSLLDYNHHCLPDELELINCVLPCSSPSWNRSLYNYISALDFCKVIGHNGLHKISILGRLINVTITIDICQWLTSQIDLLCQDSCVNNFRVFDSRLYQQTQSEALESYRRSFYIQIVSNLYEHLRDLQNESIKTNPQSCKFVIYLCKETKDYVNKIYPDLVMNGVRL